MTIILCVIGAIIAGVFRGVAIFIVGVLALIFIAPIILGFLGGLLMGILRAIGAA